MLDFIKKLQNDRDLQDKLEAAVRALPEGLSEEETFEKAVRPLAKEAGFDLRWEDAVRLKEQQAAGGEACSEDELARTAGGADPICFFYGKKSDENALCIVMGFDSSVSLRCFTWGE